MTVTTAPKPDVAAPAPASRSMAHRRRLRKARKLGISLAYFILALVLGVAIWEAAIKIYDPAPYIIPEPLNVWRALRTLLFTDPSAPTGMWIQLGYTLQATAIGFALGS